MTSALRNPAAGYNTLSRFDSVRCRPSMSTCCEVADLRALIPRMESMPSAIWTGSISFGLVQVPVRLVGATKNLDVSFNQLEEGTGARIRYKKVSEQSGEEVPQNKITKGYEISKGRYVTIENDEIETLRPKATHTIDIEEFVDLDEIDPLYFEQPYYLAADKRGV